MSNPSTRRRTSDEDMESKLRALLDLGTASKEPLRLKETRAGSAGSRQVGSRPTAITRQATYRGSGSTLPPTINGDGRGSVGEYRSPYAEGADPALWGCTRGSTYRAQQPLTQTQFPSNTTSTGKTKKKPVNRQSPNRDCIFVRVVKAVGGRQASRDYQLSCSHVPHGSHENGYVYPNSCTLASRYGQVCRIDKRARAQLHSEERDSMEAVSEQVLLDFGYVKPENPSDDWFKLDLDNIR